MPPRHYRDRTKKVNKYLINTDKNQSNCQNNITINTIQQHFFDTIDSIILYSDMNISIKEIKSLIAFISSKEELYVFLDKIENITESIVMNITEDVSVGIIQDRIAYVRSLLSSLPDNFDNYTDISFLILNILESIIKSFDLNTVHKNIMYIQQLMTIDMNEYDNIQDINFTIFSILTNIGDEESIFIIKERINYLQTLINKLS